MAVSRRHHVERLAELLRLSRHLSGDRENIAFERILLRDEILNNREEEGSIGAGTFAVAGELSIFHPFPGRNTPPEESE